MSNISDYIKRHRKKYQLSQSDFANKIHVTKQAVSKWETGRGIPDVSLIPVIAKEIGISIDELMGAASSQKRKKWIYRVIIIVLVVLLIISPYAVIRYQEHREFVVFKRNIEQQTGLALPDLGSSEYTGYNSWYQYGNAIQVREMSYLIFDETLQSIEFEDLLEDDDRWVKEIEDELSVFIPFYLSDFTTKGDYYIVYNIDLDTFNEVSDTSDKHEYVFLVYQKEHNRLLVFEYFLGDN